MQNTAFLAMSLNCVYVPFCPPEDKLDDTMAGIRALGIAGVNVTVPYKEMVIPYLDEVTGEAALYQAVNTIINKHGKLIGHNTDGPGFINALREEHRFNPAQGPALIFGSGGSARAVAVALALAGCPEMALVNRRVEKARMLAESVSNKTGSRVQVFHWDENDKELVDFAQRAVIMVNCTPVGMSGQVNIDFPLPASLPGQGQLAYDLVYNPPLTPFLTRAAGNGAHIANGLSMLLHQGALSFQIWTGTGAPLEVMRRELYKQTGIDRES